MDFEELVRLHKEISQHIEDLEEQKKALGVSILQQMKSKSLKVGPYVVRSCSRLSIAMSIEEARALNATKMKEVVDNEIVKDLYNRGTPVPGVKEINYIQILTSLR